MATRRKDIETNLPQVVSMLSSLKRNETRPRREDRYVDWNAHDVAHRRAGTPDPSLGRHANTGCGTWRELPEAQTEGISKLACSVACKFPESLSVEWYE